MVKQRPMHPAELCRHNRRHTQHPKVARDTSGSSTRPGLRRRAHLATLSACSLLVLTAACRTTPSLPPVDLTDQGWQLRHGQAIWRLPKGDTELAGELTSGVHPNGSIFLEFTKTPMTLVVARIDSLSWQLNLVADNRSYQGRGQPPSRSTWLVLALALADRPLPAGWEWSGTDSGNWRLENSRTGEQLRGYWQR